MHVYQEQLAGICPDGSFFGYFCRLEATIRVRVERNGENCVKKAAAGDSAAFGLLVEEHAPWLLVRLTRRLGSQEAAEDVLQEAFIAAYRQLAELRSPERFGAWLCSIADNKARMWQRRRLTQLNLLNQLDLAAPPEQEKKEIGALVRKAIGRLSVPHRDVLVHHYLKGYSYQQTANLLHLRTGLVKSRLQKARKRLQKEIIAMAESNTAQTFELGPADLAGLRRVARFRSDDPNRPILQCVCLDAGGRIVANDGRRLLNWSSKGLASLPAPVILDSMHPEMIPEADSATLILEEESATLQASDGHRVTFPAITGPYVKYQKAVGTPGPILVVVRSEHLMSCVEEIEPFLRDRHELAKSGWKYVPGVEMRVSSAKGKLALRTTRDQGYLRTRENADELHGNEFPDWEHSVSCPADVANIEDGGSFRVGLNHDFLKSIVEALEDAAEELRIYLDQRKYLDLGPSPLHFVAGEVDHTAVLIAADSFL